MHMVRATIDFQVSAPKSGSHKQFAAAVAGVAAAADKRPSLTAIVKVTLVPCVSIPSRSTLPQTTTTKNKKAE